MLRVREAVQRAQEYLPDVFESANGKEMRLEGVELTDDAKFWSVTFSYQVDKTGLGNLGRDYKTVRLRAEDGEFFGARNGYLISDL